MAEEGLEPKKKKKKKKRAKNKDVEDVERVSEEEFLALWATVCGGCWMCKARAERGFDVDRSIAGSVESDDGKLW